MSDDSDIPHLSSLIPHLSSLIPHPSSLIPHPSSLIPHPSSSARGPNDACPSNAYSSVDHISVRLRGRRTGRRVALPAGHRHAWRNHLSGRSKPAGRLEVGGGQIKR